MLKRNLTTTEFIHKTNIVTATNASFAWTLKNERLNEPTSLRFLFIVIAFHTDSTIGRIQVCNSYTPTSPIEKNNENIKLYYPIKF